MNSYKYQDVKWKVYGNVNDGTVLKELNVKDEYKLKLSRILGDSLGVMSFTGKNEEIFYEIKELETGYSIVIQWTSTKLKSETTMTFLAIIKSNEDNFESRTAWRSVIITYLKSLVSDCSKVDYTYSLTDSKAYVACLQCEIPFQNLYSFPKGEDIPDKDFSYREKNYSVPPELLEFVISENIREAIKYFGTDHQKLFDILRPFEGKEYFADFLIGSTYYMYLDMPHKAYAYFIRCLNILQSQNLEAPKLLLDFLGNIEIESKNDPENAEQFFIGSLLVGNEHGFLKLAYLYLQQAQNDKKELALSLVEIGEKILPHDEDLNHRFSGYHIVASVYLWNRMFQEAEQAHRFYLSDQDWCSSYPELVKPYIIMAIALNDEIFLSNLILDYPILRQRYQALFDTWLCKTINPIDKRFGRDFIEALHMLELTKKIYEIKD